MYKCQYFKIQELVPPELFKKYGEKCWLLFDERLLMTADAIRTFVGSPCVINNGSTYTQSGYGTDDIGAKLSQHKNGRALDLKFSTIKGVDGYNKLRKRIIDNRSLFPYLRGLEDNINWLHIDVGNRVTELEIFIP